MGLSPSSTTLAQTCPHPELSPGHKAPTVVLNRKTDHPRLSNHLHHTNRRHPPGRDPIGQVVSDFGFLPTTLVEGVGGNGTHNTRASRDVRSEVVEQSNFT